MCIDIVLFYARRTVCCALERPGGDSAWQDATFIFPNKQLTVAIKTAQREQVETVVLAVLEAWAEYLVQRKVTDSLETLGTRESLGK